MKARYRVVHFVPDPFVGGRVPIAALVEHDGGKVDIAKAPHVPGPVCLGGHAASSTVQIILEDLAHVTHFDRLPMSLGPQAVLDMPFDVPRGVENPVEWIKTRLFAHQVAHRHEGEHRSPNRATYGYRFFENYKVAQFVKKTFHPGEDANGYLASATVLKPIAHYVEGKTDLLLMEPVVLRRSTWQDDVTAIATNFGAYKTAIRHERGPRKPRLTAYVLAGGTRKDFNTIAHELAPFADEIVNTADPIMRADFITRIRETGQSNQPPNLFGN